MKKVFTPSIIAFGFVLLNVAAFAQPSNDLPCNALPITLNAPASLYSNVDATSEINEPGPTIQNCYTGWCELDVDSSMWFTFVAPANGAVVVNTCLPNSPLDAQVAVYAVTDCGDYSTYTLIGANDDTPGGCAISGTNFSSTLQLDGLTFGTTYYLQVDGYGGDIDNYYLEIASGIPLAKVKFVNNCADLLIPVMDIRVDGMLVVDNFGFRTHTDFLDVLAQQSMVLTIHDANSIDATNPLYSITLNLDAASNYIMVGSGIISSTGYSPNTPFEMDVFDSAILANQTVDMIDLLFYHGSTDAPAIIDIENFNDGLTIADNIGYGAFSNNYSPVPVGLYPLDVTDAGGTPIGQTFCANWPFGPQTMIVLSSGFVDPTVNSNGADFGLFTVNNNFGGAFTPLFPNACTPPTNDQPCNAVTLVINDAPTAATNQFATGDENEAHPAGINCQDSISWCAFDSLATISVWFKFVANATGLATVSTCLAGTMLDTQVAVYEVGNCSDYTTYTILGANDDTPGGCPAAQTTFASFLNMYNLTPNSTYYVQVDGYGGNSNPFDIQITAPVGVEELNSIRAFSIYPNPAKDKLTVRYAGKAPVQIYDSRGALVFSQQINGTTEIDVSELATGVYSISIVNENAVQTLRFVVE